MQLQQRLTKLFLSFLLALSNFFSLTTHAHQSSNQHKDIEQFSDTCMLALMRRSLGDNSFLSLLVCDHLKVHRLQENLTLIDCKSGKKCCSKALSRKLSAQNESCFAFVFCTRECKNLYSQRRHLSFLHNNLLALDLL